MNRLCADGRGPGACSESASSAFLDGLLRGDGGGGLPGARVLPLVLAPAPTAYGGHRLGVIFPNKGRCRGAGRGVCVCVCVCVCVLPLSMVLPVYSNPALELPRATSHLCLSAAFTAFT